MSVTQSTDSIPPPPGRAPAGDSGSLARLALLLGGIVALGVLGSWWAVAVVLALVVVIALHELGHYLTAKWAGMKVTEYFIGFGPRIWSFRRGETEYGLKVIPAGAYVKVIGMSNLEEVDAADEPRTYRQQPYWRRLSVAVAGSAMHFLLAIVLLFVVLVGWGIPRGEDWQVADISPDSPAAEADLRPGDRIVAVDGVEVSTFEDASEVLRARPGKTVELVVERDDARLALEARLADRNPSGAPVGFLGFSPESVAEPESVLGAVVESVRWFGRGVALSVEGIVSLFTPGGLDGYVDRLRGEAPEATGATGGGGGGGGGDDGARFISVVGAVRFGAQAAAAGTVYLLHVLISLNIFIGLFNLVPLLPLDGGHVAVATYERIRSRNGRRYHVDMAKLMPITYAVFAVLAMIGVTSLYLDIVDPAQNPFGG